MSWVTKNKWLILASLGFLVLSLIYSNKIFAIKFVDEEDNLILGYFLQNGQKLYSDLFSHHQPLAYILSAAIQLISQPKEVYDLIKIHREFIIFWSFSWCFTLVWRFKEKVIIPLFIYELSKFYLYGNLFLSESLALYPILYLVLLVLSPDKIKKAEYFLTGLFIGFSALILAPVWPMLAIYSGLFIWLKKPAKQQFIFLILGALIPVLIALPFIDLKYYFHNVFYINYKYYIPQSAEEKFPTSIIKAIFSPISIYLSNWEMTGTNIVLKIVGIFFFISCAFLIKQKKYKLLLLSLSLLTFANFRYYTPGLDYSAGFHLLIWYALFILFSFYLYIEVFNSKTSKYFMFGLLIIGISGIVFSSKNLLKITDQQQDYEKNYSKQHELSQAIKSIKGEDDTLFVVPDEWLLYFGSGVKNNNRMINYYGWMSLVWELNDPVIEKFKNDPPSFFYCDCSEDYVLNYSENYLQLSRDGAKIPLWILNSKLNSLTDHQKEYLRSQRFQF